MALVRADFNKLGKTDSQYVNIDGGTPVSPFLIICSTQIIFICRYMKMIRAIQLLNAYWKN